MILPQKALFCALGLAVWMAAPAMADDPSAERWHFVRGPHFNGHAASTGLAESWPAAGPPVLWTRTLGQGYSSFVAWDNRVATLYQTLGGQYVICLDSETGKTLWEHRYDWPHDPDGLYPGPRATPTFYQGSLYYAAPGGVVGCLDAENGHLRWKVDTKKEFGGDGTDFGYSCSPTLIEGKLLLPLG